MRKEIEISGLVSYYVVKNADGQYLVDIMDEYDGTSRGIWTKNIDAAWQYDNGSVVVFGDAKSVGGKVYAVVEVEG